MARCRCKMPDGITIKQEEIIEEEEDNDET